MYVLHTFGIRQCIQQEIVWGEKQLFLITYAFINLSSTFKYNEVCIFSQIGSCNLI